MDKISAIVLAAGEGKRMKSKKPKVIHEILGKPVIQYVLDAASGASIEDICIVIGHQGDDVKAVLKDQNVAFALQEKQLGTGHACLSAAGHIPDGDVFVLCGDTPLITSDTLRRMGDFHKKNGNGVTLLSAFLDNPEGYGRIIRNTSGQFLRIVEQKDAGEDEKVIKEINSGVYCFKGAVLKKALSQLNNDNAQGEFYLTDTIELIVGMGYGAEALVAENANEFYGINSRSQLALASSLMRNRIQEKWMDRGVTLEDPVNTYIGPDAEIGEDTIIYPGCYITGKTSIGPDAVIGPNSKIHNCNIGGKSSVQSSFVSDSAIGDETTVGPFAYVRPGCRIGSHCRIGDFVEIKNSVIGDHTKVSHLTYVGDSDVGNHINFGCGTVTVNYDGKKKYRTVIEDDVFLGCNTNLVAPVTVKKGSYIAAGSTITRDVPENSLAIARSRQENKEGYRKLK